MMRPPYKDSIASPRGAAPDISTRIYAIGDIHGRSDLLSEVIDRIDDHSSREPADNAIEIYLGDYIDRGSDSKGVIDILCRRLVFRNAICLRGNHELMLENFLQDKDVLRDWAHLGGLNTLQSYGIQWSTDRIDLERIQQALVSTLPETHRVFLRCLRNTFISGDYFFAHAGLRPGVSLAEQSLDDMLWIRDEFLKSEQDHGHIVVHGHTPVQHPDIRRNRINIDTGAVWSDHLTCMVLEGSSISFL